MKTGISTKAGIGTLSLSLLVCAVVARLTPEPNVSTPLAEEVSSQLAPLPAGLQARQRHEEERLEKKLLRALTHVYGSSPCTVGVSLDVSMQRREPGCFPSPIRELDRTDDSLFEMMTNFALLETWDLQIETIKVTLLLNSDHALTDSEVQSLHSLARQCLGLDQTRGDSLEILLSH